MGQNVEVFSTQGVPGPRKLERWNAILREFFDTIQVGRHDPQQFDGMLIRQRVGRLSLFEVRCGGIRVKQTRAQAVKLTRPTYQLMMPVHSEFTFTHGGKPAATVGAGSLCLIDRAEPYEMAHGDGLRAIGVEFPRALLETCLPQAGRYAGSVMRPVSGASRVLSGLMHTLGSELSHDATGALPAAMARSIATFVATAFTDQDRGVQRKGVKARLAAYCEYVESRLGDGDFRPVDVARQFQVSERYVRMVFQSAGEPLSEFLLRRRLERAAKLLRGTEYAQQTVMEIALDCGFNSASHFGHSFRQHYGLTPREYRVAER